MPDNLMTSLKRRQETLNELAPPPPAPEPMLPDRPGLEKAMAKSGIKGRRVTDINLDETEAEELLHKIGLLLNPQSAVQAGEVPLPTKRRVP